MQILFIALGLHLRGEAPFLLGEGSHGQVFRVEEGALKVFSDIDCLEQEYRMLCLCSELFGLVKLIDRTHENALLLEYLPGQTLDKLCGRLSESEVLHISRQIISIVANLHAHLFLHRDLKSSNIIISPQMEVTIIDLGSMQQGESAWTLGSWPWMPPEVLIHGQQLTMKGEVWSIGMLMVEMILGETLIEKFANNIVARLEEIRDHGIEISCGENLTTLIRAALTHDPDQRPSCEQLAKMIFTNNY